MATPGFRIKIHHALIAPILFAGVPRRFAILNGTVAAALGLGLHMYYMLLVGAGIHVFGAYLAKKDPLFFEIILRYLRQRKFYNI